MSTMTYAPPVVLTGPPPVAPRFNLFTVAQEISDAADERWFGGVSVYGYPSGVPRGFDPCATGSGRVKEEGDAPPIGVFATFTAYLPERCTMGGISSWEDFTARAERTLDATDAFAAERQLVRGDYVPTNPFLGDLDADILNSGAATAALEALARLEDAISETGRRGVIHATAATATVWANGGGFMVEGGQLRTSVGTPVVVGYGYRDVDDPISPENGDDPAAGEAWAFASGPLIYRRGPIEPIGADVAQTLNREDNDLVFRAERDLIIAWDTALQAAVRVNWSP